MISSNWQSGSILREVTHLFDNRESETRHEWTASVDFPEDQVRRKVQLTRILTSIPVLTGEQEYTFNLPYALSQENFELRQHIDALSRRIHELEQRLVRLEEVVPEEKIVILREVPREQAEREIRALFTAGETLYYSDIAERLGLDLELVVEICRRLQEQGEIEVSGDLL